MEVFICICVNRDAYCGGRSPLEMSVLLFGDAWRWVLIPQKFTRRHHWLSRRVGSDPLSGAKVGAVGERSLSHPVKILPEICSGSRGHANLLCIIPILSDALSRQRSVGFHPALIASSLPATSSSHVSRHVHVHHTMQSVCTLMAFSNLHPWVSYILLHEIDLFSYPEMAAEPWNMPEVNDRHLQEALDAWGINGHGF